MPRKVPFSAKQKKVQLKQKRERKRDAFSDETEASNDFNEEVTIIRPGTSTENFSVENDLLSVNEQPTDIIAMRNRFNLIFKKETKEEINRSKEESMKPLSPQPEITREITYHSFYENALKHHIEIPKRPPWDYSLSKAKLLALEQRYFVNYLDDLEKKFGSSLGYMDLNLETWRQLWRVLEMSDIVLLIADIRHPVLHFSPALFESVKKMGKDVILVLNKIDLVPPSLVLAWKYYFKENFPELYVVCLTAFAGSQIKTKKIRKYKLANEISSLILSMCKDIVKEAVDLSSWETKLKEEESDSETYADEEDDDEYEPPTKGPINVVKNDTSYYTNQRYNGGVLTIGLVGHPNVGKSSVLNALMGKKVVSVSRTPGHTKHFQTIFLTNSVKLCDCPGLVFPSLAPKQLQVLSGCFPIAQVREPYSIVGYFSQYLPVPQILKIRHPNGDREAWSAYDICEAWALKRGFLSAKSGRPDVHRAANNLLRMALDGRTICLAFYPPDFIKNKSSWEAADEIESIRKQFSLGANENIEEIAISDSDGSASEESGRESGNEASSAGRNKFSILSETLE